MGSNIGIVDSIATKKRINREDIITTFDLMCRITNFTTDNPTSLGSMMECIKLSEFVIGDIRYDTSHLALLLGTTLIHVESSIKENFIKLLNPLGTPMIISDNIVKGIDIYENNF